MESYVGDGVTSTVPPPPCGGNTITTAPLCLAVTKVDIDAGRINRRGTPFVIRYKTAKKI